VDPFLRVGQHLHDGPAVLRPQQVQPWFGWVTTALLAAFLATRAFAPGATSTAAALWGAATVAFTLAAIAVTVAVAAIGAVPDSGTGHGDRWAVEAPPS
jgi:hypothetical protein